MKKTTIMTLLFFGVFTSTTEAQQSINAAGGNASGNGGSISFSVGQIDYTCNSGSGGTASQGVQQFNQILEFLEENNSNINVEPEVKAEMVVYPNPTTDLVNLKIENYKLDQLSYALFDMQGRQIATNKILQNETQIQMNSLASAIYLLTIFENNKILKTFKIIKKNN